MDCYLATPVCEVAVTAYATAISVDELVAVDSVQQTERPLSLQQLLELALVSILFRGFLPPGQCNRRSVILKELL
jgi:hypothetical protein